GHPHHRGGPHAREGALGGDVPVLHLPDGRGDRQRGIVQSLSFPSGKPKATSLKDWSWIARDGIDALKWATLLSQSALASNRQVSPTVSPVAASATGSRVRVSLRPSRSTLKSM